MPIQAESTLASAIQIGDPVSYRRAVRTLQAFDGVVEEATERQLADAAALAAKNGIEVHAGHGLTFDNVVPIAAIPQLAELNIGHFLIGEAIFDGLEASIRKMRQLMDEAR